MLLTLGSIRAFWLADLPALPLVLCCSILIVLVARHIRHARASLRLQLHDDDSWSLEAGSKSFRSAQLIDTTHRSAHRIDLVLCETHRDGRSRRHYLTVASDSLSDVDFSFLHLQCALNIAANDIDNAGLVASARAVANRFTVVPEIKPASPVSDDRQRVQRSDKQ